MLLSHVGVIVLIANINRGSRVTPNGLFGDAGSALFNSAALALFIFFALSGYLIAGPFIRAIASGGQAPRIGSYLLNRALRIVPAFWVILTVLVLVIGTGAGPWSRFALPGVESSSLSQVASIYGFAQFTTTSSPALWNLIPQAWTLDVEVVFYIAVPLIGVPLAALAPRLSAGQRIAVVACVATAGCGTTLVLTASHNIFEGEPGLFGPGSPFWYMWAFAPGLVLALAEAAGAPELLRRSSQAGDWVPRLLIAVAVVAFAVYAIAYEGPPGGARDIGALLWILAFSFAAVGAALAREWSGRGAYRALVSGPLTWVGKRSYSLYLIHVAVLLQLGSVALDVSDSAYVTALALLGMALPLCLVFAHASYELVERPFLRLRTKPYGRHPDADSSRRRGWRVRPRRATAQSEGPG